MPGKALPGRLTAKRRQRYVTLQRSAPAEGHSRAPMPFERMAEQSWLLWRQPPEDRQWHACGDLLVSPFPRPGQGRRPPGEQTDAIATMISRLRATVRAGTLPGDGAHWIGATGTITALGHRDQAWIRRYAQCHYSVAAVLT